MAAGLSASDLGWAARSSWAFFASAAALRRSAKLAFLDQFISVFYAQENGSWPKGSTVSDRRSPRHIPGMVANRYGVQVRNGPLLNAMRSLDAIGVRSVITSLRLPRSLL